MDTLLKENNPTLFAAFLELFNGMLAADCSLLSFSRFFFASYSTHVTHWASFHSLPDCTSLQQLVRELELIAKRSKSTKRLDKAIYSLFFIEANQPFQMLSIFPSVTDDLVTTKENSILRQSISSNLKVLENAVPTCNNTKTLKNIQRIVMEAAAEISLN